MKRNEDSSELRAPRIAVFTHDTYGLGHVRRSLHIMRALAQRDPDSALLLITGSPALHALRGLPANADYVKIPTIVKTGASGNRPSHLPIGVRETTSLRKRLIRSTLESFQPDLFLVDNFPLGSRKELKPALKSMNERGVRCVLGLRDIVDRPKVVRANWEKDGIYDVLRDSYDRVLIYGLPEILEAGEAYAMPPDLQDKLRYCGYVTARLAPAPPLPQASSTESPLVLATVGGGGDGYPLLEDFVKAVQSLAHIRAVAITGPLMSEADRKRLRDLAAGEPRIAIEDSVSDLPSRMRAADLVIAMGGYNTTAELLALQRFALIVPRNWRYGEYAHGTSAGMEWEQTMRAEAMQRMGLVRLLSPDSLTAHGLAEEIVSGLKESQQPTRSIEVGGVERVADELLTLVQERSNRVQV